MADQSYDNEITAIKNDLASLRKDMQALMTSIAENQKNMSRETAERVQNATKQARAELNRLSEEAGTRGREGMNAIETHIEERPFASVLTAFGIGLLLGKILDR